MKPFLDATVIALAFTENPAKEKCRALLQVEFVTDALCIVEARKTIAKVSKDTIYAAVSIKSLFKGSGTILSLDKNLLFNSLKPIASDLDAFDSVHYVAALFNGCSEVVSFDKDFDNLELPRTEP